MQLEQAELRLVVILTSQVRLPRSKPPQYLCNGIDVHERLMLVFPVKVLPIGTELPTSDVLVDAGHGLNSLPIKHQSEVGNHEDAFVPHQNVLWLQVSMNL